MQRSSDNPGWRGPGIPSLKRLLMNMTLGVARGLLSGECRFALNLLVATLANLWNFKVWTSSDHAVECPCCGLQSLAFLAKSNWREVAFQSSCPQCDSRSRHRGLTGVLPELVKQKPAGPILLFAPELILIRLLWRLSADDLVTTDFKSVDVDFPNEDIERLSFSDASYAMVVCNHVLEHVADDQKGLNECARVLKPGGVAVFTLPGNFDTYATWQFTTPDANGHHRHYGMDIIEKMKKAFSRIRAQDMSVSVPAKWCVRRGDYVFLCYR